MKKRGRGPPPLLLQVLQLLLVTPTAAHSTCSYHPLCLFEPSWYLSIPPTLLSHLLTLIHTTPMLIQTLVPSYLLHSPALVHIWGCNCRCRCCSPLLLLPPVVTCIWQSCHLFTLNLPFIVRRPPSSVICHLLLVSACRLLFSCSVRTPAPGLCLYDTLLVYI